jgi:hypothetical protein
MVGLALEAVVRLAITRVMLLVLPLPRSLGGGPPAHRHAGGAHHTGEHHTEDVHRIRRAILAAARRVPWRSQCLEQSIAAQRMLRARGIPATLYLGVEKRGDALRAHAWVRSGDIFVTGGDGSDRYSIVSVLG